jgi:hypothetical protein
MVKAHDSWRDLYRSDDLHLVRTVATCLEAMAFETRIQTPGGPRPDRVVTPHVVQVSTEDWESLVEVLPELIAEQQEFDEFLRCWHQRSGRSERRLLVAMIVIVGTLAVIGAIEL